MLKQHLLQHENILKMILIDKNVFFSDDHNRVILEPEEGVPDSDYINASYVDVSFMNN